MARPRRPRISPALAQRRRALGLTQEQVGERLGLSVEMIRRHERGEALPGERFRQAYTRLYRASESDLGLTARRGGAVPSEPSVVNLSVAVGDGERIGPDDLAEIHRLMRQLVTLDNQFGGTELVRVAVRFLRSLTRQLGAGMVDSAIADDVVAAVGELAEITGWLAYDADQQKLVRRMNQEALYYSRLAGDTTIELLTVQNASMHAGHTGRPFEALQLANSVLDGPYRLSARVRSLFLVRRARALAQGGDSTALRTLAEATSLHDDGVADADPDWAWWIDRRELWWHEAMCRSDLGDPGGAVEAFERSADAVPRGETRSRFIHDANLARAQLRVASWDSARATLDRLRPLAVQVASARGAAIITSAAEELHRGGAVVPPDVHTGMTALTGTLSDELP